MNRTCPACGHPWTVGGSPPATCPHCDAPWSREGSDAPGLATTPLGEFVVPPLPPPGETAIVDPRQSINVRHLPATEAVAWEQVFASLAAPTIRPETESLPGIQTGRNTGLATTILPVPPVPASEPPPDHRQPTVRLSVPARFLADRAVVLSAPPTSPTPRLDYELLNVIGQGGMGVVYAARQTSVDREVAVKMIYPEQAQLENVRNDFLTEAVITGELDHPNIVPIHELGQGAGATLFYSMKRVTGTPWGKSLPANSEGENLRILLAVSDAVAFAHSRGVVHRDLKPDNVMLGEFGEVLLMDWGLALVTPEFRKPESVPYTPSPGCTPAYAAPELITGPLSAIGPRSDVYLLGAILFQIVTGKLPHAAQSARECCLVAARNEIVATDAVGELVEIARRAMATRPADRHASVREFQQAIREYQSHSESLSLGSRAADDLDRARGSLKYDDFARSLYGFDQALALWSGNSRAESGRQQARLAYAQAALANQDFDLGLTLLDPAEASHQPLHAALRTAQTERNERIRRLQTLKRLAIGLAAVVFAVVSGALVWINYERGLAVAAEATATEQRDQARLARDREEQQRVIAERAEKEARKERDNANRARIQEELQRAAAEQAKDEAEDRRLAAERAEQEERRQRLLAEQARRAQEFEAYVAEIGLADEQIKANAFDAALDALTGQERFPTRGWEWNRLNYLARQGQSASGRAPAEIEGVAIDPVGKRFAVGSRDGVIRVGAMPAGIHPAEFDLLAGATELTLGSPVRGVSFSADGQLLAAAGERGRLAVWNVESLEAGPTLLTGHESGSTLTALAFARRDDRRWLVSAGSDRTVRVWDVSGSRERWPDRPIQTLLGHQLAVLGVAVSPDGRQLVSAGEDGNAVVWTAGATADQPFVRATAGERPDGTPRYRVFRRHDGGVRAVAFHPEGRLVATAGMDRRIFLWNPQTVVEEEIGEFLQRRDNLVESVRPTGDLLVLEGHRGPVDALAFSPDGETLISGSEDHTVRVWSWRRPLEEPTILRGHGGGVRSCAVLGGNSPSADLQVLSGAYDRQLKQWNVPGYAEVRVLRARPLLEHSDAVTSAAFSPAGDRLVTVSRDHTALVYDLSADPHSPGGVDLSKKPRELSEGHQFSVVTGRFFGAGQYAATAGIDGQVCLWNIATGTQIGRLPGTGLSAPLSVSGDGQWILTGRSGNALALWNIPRALEAFREGREAVPEDLPLLAEAHSARVRVLAFSPVDSQIFFSADTEGGGLLWNLSRPESPRTALPLDQQRISAARFTPDGERLVTASDEGWIDFTELASGTVTLRLDHQPGAAVAAFDFTADAQRLLSVAEPNVPGEPYLLFDWDLTTGRRLQATSLEPGWLVFGVDCSPTDASQALLAVGRRSGGRAQGRVDTPQTELLRWDLTNWGPPRNPADRTLLSEARLGRERAVVWSAEFHPLGNLVLTVGGNEAGVWNAVTGQLAARLGPHGTVSTASFSPGGEFVATGSWDESFKLWRVTRDSTQPLARVSSPGAGAVNAVQFVPRRPDDPPGRERLVTAHDNGDVRLWNWNSSRPEELPVLQSRLAAPQGSAALGCSFPEDGRLLAVGFADGVPRIYSLQTGELVLQRELRGPGHQGGIRAVAFTRDGEFLATGGDDKQTIVWQVATGEPWLAEPLRGHAGEVTSVAFSGEGDRLLTGSSDGTAKLWDPRTGPTNAQTNRTDRLGKELLSLTGHAAAVSSACFSPDDRLVLTTSLDGSARLWLSDAPPRLKAGR